MKSIVRPPLDPASELTQLDFLAPDKDAAALGEILNTVVRSDTLVMSALGIALNAHDNQFRDEGDPYIVHPLRVAISLAGLGARSTIVAAALCHDIHEDAPMHSRFVRELHPEVALLVEAVTDYWDEDYHAKIIAAGRDAARIKMADRIDNLRFIHRTAFHKQMRYVRGTSHRFGPVAAAAEHDRLSIALDALLEWHLDRIERTTPF